MISALSVTSGNPDWQFWSLIALATVIGAALASASMTHLLHPVLARYALARPNTRSSHQRATPQGGGLAVIAATIGFASLLCRFDRRYYDKL